MSKVAQDLGIYVALDGHDMASTAWTSLVQPSAKGMAKGVCVYLHRPFAQARGLLKSEFLLQDGVLAAHNGEAVLRDLPREIACYALRGDLALRGFTPLKVREQVQVADYARLVDLFDQHTR